MRGQRKRSAFRRSTRVKRSKNAGIGFIETNQSRKGKSAFNHHQIETNRLIIRPFQLIVLLKGVGNMGILSKSLESRVRELITNDGIATEIRLHAVTVHRRCVCVQNRDYFIDVYRNASGNSEVRIAAYLEARRCPDYISMKHIKYVLKHEEVNQVGSFVWSHLKNTAKSASPVRVEAQGLLVDDDLGNKYNMDLRKFSRNFERSLFFDEYNVGASGEGNLIFGTDSYMPRSASLNFTVDLFGESINIFEVNAYMQGFEHMVEGMFGPKGPLSTEGFSKKLNKATQFVKDKIEPLKSKLDFAVYRDKFKLKISILRSRISGQYQFTCAS